jgi:hypothetical protein
MQAIIQHPQFWVVVGLSYGIASDILAATPWIRANGVAQLVIQLISEAIAGQARKRR